MADEEVLAAPPQVEKEEASSSALAFDPTKKKKKKKVRLPSEEEAEAAEKLQSLSVAEPADSMFAGLKKKPKKVKKPAEGGAAAEEGDDGAEQGDAAANGEGAADGDGDDEGDGGGDGEEVGDGGALAAFPPTKKKKPKKVRAPEDELPEEALADDDFEGPEGDDDDGEEAEPIELGRPTKLPWEGTDRDYHYDELLDRVFNILRENNPELAGEKRRTVMRPPQVLREGTKKTVFVNFMDLCKTMHRQPEHVMAFLLAELGTSGSLDGQQRLIVKGRFAPKNFEGILRRYVNEYVICSGCKSADTILSKENRLFFLRCEQCGSSRSVAPIKAGFVARVGRRKVGP